MFRGGGGGGGGGGKGPTDHVPCHFLLHMYCGFVRVGVVMLGVGGVMVGVGAVMIRVGVGMLGVSVVMLLHPLVTSCSKGVTPGTKLERLY